MKTYLEIAKFLFIILIFFILIYFFNDLKNADLLFKERFESSSYILTYLWIFLYSPVDDSDVNVTYDCNDWSLPVNLSAHPMGTPGHGGSVSVPEVSVNFLEIIP